MKKELQDRAWRSLPEEFRKEVREQYDYAFNMYRNSGEHFNQIYFLGIMNAIDNIFGVDRILEPDTSHEHPESENHPSDTSHGKGAGK